MADIISYRFNSGFRKLEDDTLAPVNSLRYMKNCTITDRGGIAKRKGTSVLGTWGTSSYGINGHYNFVMSILDREILLRGNNTQVEFYNSLTSAWEVLKSGFTSGKYFGFIKSATRLDRKDTLYFGNGYDDVYSWNGAYTRTTSALVGGETSIPIENCLTDTVYFANTATASSTTTITMPAGTWVTDQWNGFWVKITSGAQSGKIAQITDTTDTTLTFNTISGLSGTPTFEIHENIFSASGSIIIDATEVAYTGFSAYNAMTVASAPAKASGVSVAELPNKQLTVPRGNRFELLNDQLFVGNVSTGTIINGSGDTVASGASDNVFISKSTSNTDFGQASPRIAGDGEVLKIPQGGRNITDLKMWQDQAVFIYKKDYIAQSAVKENIIGSTLTDIWSTKQVGTYGSITQVLSAYDDHYFITGDKQFTTISRLLQKDLKPQQRNIGYIIKRFLESRYYKDNSQMGAFENKIFIPLLQEESDSSTMEVLIYNRGTDGTNSIFEGIWTIPLNGFVVYNGTLYGTLDNTPNILLLNSGLNDEWDTTYPISSEFKTSFSKQFDSFSQGVTSNFGVRGYIKQGSTITFDFYKDRIDTPFTSFDFTPVEGEDDYKLILTEESSASLGVGHLGSSPLGTVSITKDSSDNPLGYYYFKFFFYFPYVYSDWFSWGCRNGGLNQDFEILEGGFNINRDEFIDSDDIKN